MFLLYDWWNPSALLNYSWDIRWPWSLLFLSVPASFSSSRCTTWSLEYLYSHSKAWLPETSVPSPVFWILVPVSLMFSLVLTLACFSLFCIILYDFVFQLEFFILESFWISFCETALITIIHMSILHLTLTLLFTSLFTLPFFLSFILSFSCFTFFYFLNIFLSCSITSPSCHSFVSSPSLYPFGSHSLSFSFPFYLEGLLFFL